MALDIFSVFFMSGGKRAGFNCDTVCLKYLSHPTLINLILGGLSFDLRGLF